MHLTVDYYAGSLIDRSFFSEIRALFAIARKEWIIFRRYTGWVVAVLVWPVLLPFGYIMTARALGGPGGASEFSAVPCHPECCEGSSPTRPRCRFADRRR